MINKLRQVDIAPALALLPTLRFEDTGGTNGWLADSTPLMSFVQSLGLKGKVFVVNCRMLPAGQGIPLHTDPKTYAYAGVVERRFHVPLVTHPGVTMRWPGEGIEAHLEAGWLYEVRFDVPHEIVHRAPVDRVHIQINTVEAVHAATH